MPRSRKMTCKGYRMKAPASGMTMQHVVMALFHSATNAHIQHLQTESYAAHVALKGYYEGIVGLVDQVVESVQGLKGQIIRGYPLENTQFTESMTPLSYIEKIRGMFRDHRNLFPSESHIQNTLDEISDLLDSTIYKLRFLK